MVLEYKLVHQLKFFVLNRRERKKKKICVHSQVLFFLLPSLLWHLLKFCSEWICINSPGVPGGSVVRNPLVNAGNAGLTFFFFPWRRKWQPTPLFSPGESQGQGRLAGCSPWGHKQVGYNSATHQQKTATPKHTQTQLAGSSALIWPTFAVRIFLFLLPRWSNVLRAIPICFWTYRNMF